MLAIPLVVRWIGFGLALALFLLTGARAQAAGLANSPWPMFQHDAQHTGRSTHVAGSRLALRWRAPVNGIPGGPAIGEDGTIYVPTGDIHVDTQAGSLYAINPDGTGKWRFEFPLLGSCRQVGSAATPAVADDGTIYVHTQAGHTPDGASCTAGDSYLFAINPNGTEKWHFAFNDGFGVLQSSFLSSPAVGSDGTIYATSSDTALYAIDPAGTLDWAVSPSATSIHASPALGPDGTVYVSVFDLHAYQPNGAPKWTANLGDGAPNDASPAVGADGTVYACFLSPDACHAVSPAGSDQWSIPFDAGPTTPALATDGTVYLATGPSDLDGRVAALNPNGTERWHHDIPHAIDSPVVGGDGRIYTRVNTGTGSQGLADALFVLNPTDGAESDQLEVPYAGTIGDVSAAIGSDGTLYAPLPSNSFGYDPNDQYLAAFAQAARLTVSVTGSGRGRVTGPGIDCTEGLGPMDCTENYVQGTQVTLAATPSVGSFTGWSGACSGTTTCQLTMASDTSVGAVFDAGSSSSPGGGGQLGGGGLPSGGGPLIPPGGGGPGGGSGDQPPAFGERTLVTLALAATRMSARGPLTVRVDNANPFVVSGALSGETTKPVAAARKRRLKLRPVAFRVAARATTDVRMALPAALRKVLARKGKLALRLRATVRDPAGTSRTVTRTLTPKTGKARR